MAFVEREFKPENYQEYKSIVGSSVNLNAPNRWIVDSDREINFFDLGGRGEMPAHTGAPPSIF